MNDSKGFDMPIDMPDIPIVDATTKFPPGIDSYSLLLYQIKKELGWRETLPPTYIFMQRLEDKKGNFAYVRLIYDMQEVCFMAEKGH